MKIVATVRRSDAPWRKIAVERNRRAHLIRRSAEHVRRHLGRRGFVGLAAIGRAEEKRESAVLFQLNSRAVAPARAGRLFHLRKNRHIPGGVPPAGFHSYHNSNAEQTAFLALALLFFAQFLVVDFLQ